MCRLASAVLISLAAFAPLRAQGVDTMTLRAHTYFLSTDLLEGRGAGTAGERIAAAYIVAQLRRMGARPAGSDGSFLQPVPLVRATVIDAATSLTLTDGSRRTTFAHGRDFLLNTGGADAFRDFAGDLLFAGRPDSAADALARHRSLDGAVIVVTEPLGGDAVALVPDWIGRGAAGVIVLVPDPERFDLLRRSRGPARFYVDAQVADAVWQPQLPILLAGPALSTALVAGAQASADGEATRALPLDRAVAVTVRVRREQLPTANVAAIIPGSDPALRAELVAYSAHYDHIGVSTPVDGDSIYNGFSDNAAGVAMLLAIGDAFLASPPRRSILLFFFAAEERGLLGSSYAAAFPVVPLDRLAGLINLDAGAPPAPPVSWRIAGGARSPLAPTIRAVAERHGWAVDLAAASPNSDYWPFLARGVPAVFIIPGDRWEVSAAERDALRARWDRYHHPDDEWSQEFPFAGLARYAEFAYLIGAALANAP